MISKDRYELMKERYGEFGSWTIWGEKTNGKTTSGLEDMSWMDLPNILDTLNTGFVFVGENWSRNPNEEANAKRSDDHERRRIDGPWRNFHTGHKNSQTYKLREALKGTRYWGSYITDVFKNYIQKDSHKAAVGKTKEEKDEAVVELEEEIVSLGGKNPVIVALGLDAYKILKSRLEGKYKVVRVMHFSNRVNPGKYRNGVLKVLDAIP